MDPFSAISATISSSIKIFEVTYQLKAVGEQTTDLLSTTRHVTTNVNEAKRLRRLKASLLNSGESTWMDNIILDAEDALRGIAELIEPARVDRNFSNKVMWVFRDNPKVRDKHARLNVCHQSLVTVISCLYAKDVVVIAPIGGEDVDDQPPPYDPGIADLLNWKHQRRRKSSATLRNDSTTSPPLGSDPSQSSRTTPTLLSPVSSLASDSFNTRYAPYQETASSSYPAGSSGQSDPQSLPRNSNDPSSSSFPTSVTSYEGADGLQVYEPPSSQTLPQSFQSNNYPTNLYHTSTYPSPNSSAMHRPPVSPFRSEGGREGGRGSYGQGQSVNSTVGDETISRDSRYGTGGDPNGYGLEPVQSAPSSARPTSTTSNTGQPRARGRRNWLAYHATRSDVGDRMG